VVTVGGAARRTIGESARRATRRAVATMRTGAVASARGAAARGSCSIITGIRVRARSVTTGGSRSLGGNLGLFVALVKDSTGRR